MTKYGDEFRIINLIFQRGTVKIRSICIPFAKSLREPEFKLNTEMLKKVIENPCKDANCYKNKRGTEKCTKV
jgi:hypothetical protein